ncbi:MAG TPA: hypothetical protein VL086_06495 [Candidatus Nitrosotalea sp.]|nr:hypothetical protein [Candidatus Nitrosotalea sp.]
MEGSRCVWGFSGLGSSLCRTPNAYIWGTEAAALARQVSALLPAGARVLDLGCG